MLHEAPAAAGWVNSVGLVFSVSLLLSLLLVWSRRWHGHLSMDGVDGVQKLHTAPVPRVGGLAVALALWLYWLVLASGWAGRPLLAAGDKLWLLLAAGLPALAFGLLEDLTKRVGVLLRLAATMASGALAWWLTGFALTRVDVPGLDWLLGWLPLSVLFTAFAIGGVANAINIVDGLNGLAGSTALWAALGYGLMALTLGDTALAAVCFLLAAAVLGFLVVNWPLGRLFMGDGGSYFVGFALAWVAVLLVERHSHISAFAVLTVLALPVIEVLFSVFRRMMRKDHPGQPDRLHLHSLLARRYVARWCKACSPTTRNSIAGVMVGSFTLLAALLGYLTLLNPVAAPLVLLALAVGYVLLYSRMVLHRWVTPWRFLRGVRKAGVAPRRSGVARHP